MKVTLYLRIREGYKYVKPVWEGKRLKPLYGILHSTPTHFPNALGYYMRYRDKDSRVCQNVGLDPTDAVTFLRRQEAILAGVKVADETYAVAKRRTIASAIDDYMKWLEVCVRQFSVVPLRARSTFSYVIPKPCNNLTP